ncbi:glutathione S-transferase [Pikeienuella piscinae]|uniref:Glutathione S-transferase n=1 Tax=Pikeienuella piscinae TaxID=2748098 RepID=A0A7L5C017_9RHOB|nr:glutathione S-transferase [Pikeienuella piscinae]QIE55856.1 glutathione S-transferase [Pikeienuella piscinae]
MSLPTLVRIFESHRAPNPRRVSIFLAEKRVEVERVEVDIMAGEHFADAHRKKAGSHHVPVAELSDGSFLTETVAICRYVEALHPEPNLMGADAKETAVIEMWQRRMEFSVLQNIAFVARHTIPAMQALEHEQVPEWGRACASRMEEALKGLDERLRESPFIAGARFTIADITAWVALDFMRVLRRGPPDGCEALLEWHDRVKARPSATV